MKKYLKLLFVLLGVYFGARIINSDLDKIFYFLLLVLLTITLYVNKFKLSFMFFSLLFLVFSAMLFAVNSPFGNLVYYYEKTALWAFKFFVVGTLVTVVGEFRSFSKKH
jgi:hypothetical protein